jgi:hypothetical protein
VELSVSFVTENTGHITETSLLVLHREIIAVYCENQTKRTNTLCWQYVQFVVLKQTADAITTVLKGQTQLNIFFSVKTSTT